MKIKRKHVTHCPYCGKAISGAERAVVCCYMCFLNFRREDRDAE